SVWYSLYAWMAALQSAFHQRLERAAICIVLAFASKAPLTVIEKASRASSMSRGLLSWRRPILTSASVTARENLTASSDCEGIVLLTTSGMSSRVGMVTCSGAWSEESRSRSNTACTRSAGLSAETNTKLITDPRASGSPQGSLVGILAGGKDIHRPRPSAEARSLSPFMFHLTRGSHLSSRQLKSLPIQHKEGRESQFESSHCMPVARSSE